LGEPRISLGGFQQPMFSQGPGAYKCGGGGGELDCQSCLSVCLIDLGQAGAGKCEWAPRHYTPARPQDHRHAAWGGERWMLLVGPCPLDGRTPNTPPTPVCPATKKRYVYFHPSHPSPSPTNSPANFSYFARQGQPRHFPPIPSHRLIWGRPFSTKREQVCL